MTGGKKDESMGTISRTSGESVPLYLLSLVWRNVNVDFGLTSVPFIKPLPEIIKNRYDQSI